MVHGSLLTSLQSLSVDVLSMSDIAVLPPSLTCLSTTEAGTRASTDPVCDWNRFKPSTATEAKWSGILPTAEGAYRGEGYGSVGPS